jgi:xanthine dehydrogenase accessory factor
MIGSRRRVKTTLDRLMEGGISRERAEDVHAPLGLDIGAETPEEIAVAIIAEIVRERRTGVRDSITMGVKSGRLKPNP